MNPYIVPCLVTERGLHGAKGIVLDQIYYIKEKKKLKKVDRITAWLGGGMGIPMRGGLFCQTIGKRLKSLIEPLLLLPQNVKLIVVS